jgi:hypothetical protein
MVAAIGTHTLHASVSPKSPLSVLQLRDVVESPVFRGNEKFAMACTSEHVRVTGGPWRKVLAALWTVQE